jgi:hypothetical protein
MLEVLLFEESGSQSFARLFLLLIQVKLAKNRALSHFGARRLVAAISIIASEKAIEEKRRQGDRRKAATSRRTPN